MISNKKINSIIAFFTLLAIGFSLFVWLKPNSSESSLTSSGDFSYLNTVFNKNSITEINITIDEDNWNNLLENASAEEYTNADITVNGKTYYNVGIRAKGNSSLSQVASDDTTDRYSFKVKFDKYVDGQTLDGLSKIALNNVISDATYMKEYLSYDLLSKIGVKTPAFAFTNITVNGEAWGLYFGVEVIEEEFLERYYGSSTGNLYKPDSMDMNDKDGGDKAQGGNPPSDMNNTQGGNPPSDVNNTQGGNPPSDMNNTQGGNPPSDINNTQGGNPPSDMNNTQGGNPPSDMNNFQGNTSTEETNNENSAAENFTSEKPNMGGGMNMGAGGGMGSSGGTSLVYTDDNLSSYSSVLDSAVFDSTTDEDKAKVVEMIKNLNEGTNLEEYLNIDDILKYFAVNTFLVNLDSYASNMKHNYYLYENNGVFDILPWDYNLAFGAFGITDASTAINFPIDSPVTDTLENSPLIGKLLEVDEYKEKYHEYLQEIVDYVNDGTYVNTINTVDNLISNYVKNDATAFYTYEEYLEALPNLINFGLDRAKSIKAQLSGEQPSTSYGNISTTVNLQTLGTNGTGGGKSPGGKENIMPNTTNTSGDATTSASVSTDKTGGSNNNQNEIPNMNNNLDNIANNQSDNINQNTDSNNNNNNNNLSETPTNNENSMKVPTMNDNSNFNGMDQRGNNPFKENMNSSLFNKDTILLYGESIVVLIVGLIFAFTFKRRKFRS